MSGWPGVIKLTNVINVLVVSMITFTHEGGGALSAAEVNKGHYLRMYVKLVNQFQNDSYESFLSLTDINDRSWQAHIVHSQKDVNFILKLVKEIFKVKWIIQSICVKYFWSERSGASLCFLRTIHTTRSWTSHSEFFPHHLHWMKVKLKTLSTTDLTQHIHLTWFLCFTYCSL